MLEQLEPNGLSKNQDCPNEIGLNHFIFRLTLTLSWHWSTIVDLGVTHDGFGPIGGHIIARKVSIGQKNVAVLGSILGKSHIFSSLFGHQGATHTAPPPPTYPTSLLVSIYKYIIGCVTPNGHANLHMKS